MEAASVISIVPIRIWERKPLIPAEFTFEPASPEEPYILHIGRGLNDVYVGEGRGHFGPERSVIRVPVEADTLAASLVEDWLDAQYGIVKPDAVPGFFWVPGHVSKDQITDHLQTATHRQINWFQNLVKLADDDWQKYRQHKTISDIQRYAASYLKLERPWLLEKEVERQMSECPVCFSKVNKLAIVCAHCRAVLDQERYQRMQFAPVS